MILDAFWVAANLLKNVLDLHMNETRVFTKHCLVQNRFRSQTKDTLSVYVECRSA